MSEENRTKAFHFSKQGLMLEGFMGTSLLLQIAVEGIGKDRNVVDYLRDIS